AAAAKYRIGNASGRSVFPDRGSAPRVGSVVRQPRLASTIRVVADSGAAAFYRGSIADSIAAEMKRSGGLISKEHLARYRPIWREPIRGNYRGYSFIALPPSSSGGTTVTEMLNILEAYGPPARFGSVEGIHA